MNVGIFLVTSSLSLLAVDWTHPSILDTTIRGNNTAQCNLVLYIFIAIMMTLGILFFLRASFWRLKTQALTMCCASVFCIGIAGTVRILDLPNSNTFSFLTSSLPLFLFLATRDLSVSNLIGFCNLTRHVVEAILGSNPFECVAGMIVTIWVMATVHKECRRRACGDTVHAMDVHHPSVSTIKPESPSNREDGVCLAFIPRCTSREVQTESCGDQSMLLNAVAPTPFYQRKGFQSPQYVNHVVVQSSASPFTRKKEGSVRFVDGAAGGNVGNKTTTESVEGGYFERGTREHSLTLQSPLHQIIRWKKGKVLGQGAGGTVTLGLNEITGELMAVKTITFVATDPDVQMRVDSFQREITVLRKLRHPHVVRYLGAERVDTTVNIFMEYIPGGSLHTLLKQFGKLSEQMSGVYSHQILMGLVYLHGINVIHRDVKGANILVTSTGHVKLTDFGASAIVDDCCLTERHSMIGTPVWMAPEVVRCEGHNWSTDIWSLGCTVLEMLTGEPPFAHMKLNAFGVMNYLTSLDKGTVIPLPAGLSENAQNFVWQCLRVQKDERPTAYQLMAHPFITDAIRGSEKITEQYIQTVKSWMKDHIYARESFAGSTTPTQESRVLLKDEEWLGFLCLSFEQATESVLNRSGDGPTEGSYGSVAPMVVLCSGGGAEGEKDHMNDSQLSAPHLASCESPMKASVRK
eukprot:PhF_6_TR23317/c0_g1_i2/m.32956